MDELILSHCLKLGDMEDPSDLQKLHWAEEMKHIGNGHFRKENYENALLAYECALDGIVPDLPTGDTIPLNFRTLIISCFLNVVACDLKLHNYSKAISLCTHILLIDRSNVKGLYRRAQAYSKMGDYPSAIRDYKKALEIDPNNKEIRRELSNLDERSEQNKQCGS